MTSITDAIVTNRLTKHYGDRRVVDSLDLRVPQGSVYGLLGRNGAGKSTAIKMLMGIVRPDSGRATLLGEDSETLSEATRARIAYLAEGHPFYGWMTIDEADRLGDADTADIFTEVSRGIDKWLWFVEAHTQASK